MTSKELKEVHLSVPRAFKPLANHLLSRLVRIVEVGEAVKHLEHLGHVAQAEQLMDLEAISSQGWTFPGVNGPILEGDLIPFANAEYRPSR